MNGALDIFDPSQFGFPRGSLIYGFEPEVRHRIIEASQRIRGRDSFDRFWNRVLTAPERERVGGDVNSCFQQKYCAYFLVELRGWSLEQSIIEIANRIGFLTVTDYDWLMQTVGVSNPQVGVMKPVWNRASGRLELDGALLRTVKVAVAENISRVLDDFQSFNWPPNIPFSIHSDDPQKIHVVVQSLNTSLSGIRFRVQQENICWDYLVKSTS